MKVIVHHAPGKDLNAGKVRDLAHLLGEDILLKSLKEHHATDALVSNSAGHDMIERGPVRIAMDTRLHGGRMERVGGRCKHKGV